MKVHGDKMLHICSVLVLVLLAAGAVVAGEKFDVPTSVANPLLKADWAAVYENCGPMENLAGAPAMRAIKGHACLALNRNCESLELFLSIASDVDRAAWKTWAGLFAERNPRNAVAHYLAGDAYARMGEWERAVLSYSKALGIEPRFAMALSARGVAHSYLGKQGNALDDFENACSAGPDFADAHGNLGTYLILTEAPEGALEQFELATKCSNDFALARNGSGCARIGYKRDSTSVVMALREFSAALDCPPVKKLAESNIKNIMDASVASADDTLQVDEGMTLTSRDLFSMDSRMRREYMKGMSDDALMDLHGSSMRYANHSRLWAGIWDVLTFAPIDLTGKSASSWRDYDDWSSLSGDAGSELMRRGYDLSAGGARTEDMEMGYIDQGNWPVITWFGLVQRSEMPAPPPAGSGEGEK
jgi:tetratricopeptide (TPR) repeat protein